MALNLTDNWQMAKMLTDNWHLYPPIQTLSSGLQGFNMSGVLLLLAMEWITWKTQEGANTSRMEIVV